MEWVFHGGSLFSNRGHKLRAESAGFFKNLIISDMREYGDARSRGEKMDVREIAPLQLRSRTVCRGERDIDPVEFLRSGESDHAFVVREDEISNDQISEPMRSRFVIL